VKLVLYNRCMKGNSRGTKQRCPHQESTTHINDMSETNTPCATFSRLRVEHAVETATPMLRICGSHVEVAYEKLWVCRIGRIFMFDERRLDGFNVETDRL
jgi:hypothetical protein